MKWVPQAHRETQSAWFRKTSVLWHISVFLRIIFMDGIPMIETEGHISVLDDNSIQDRNTVLALMKASFALYNSVIHFFAEQLSCG